MLAERDHVREADAARVGPVEHRGDERARLRDEGELAGQRVGMREAGVEAQRAASSGRGSSGRACAAGAAARRRASPASAPAVEAGASAPPPPGCRARRARRSAPARWAAACRSRRDRAARGSSATRANARSPSSRGCFGLTACIAPAKPPRRRLRHTVAPTLPVRSVAPITATECGVEQAIEVADGHVGRCRRWRAPR